MVGRARAGRDHAGIPDAGPGGSQPGIDFQSFDDTSGGETCVDVPDFELVVPGYGESIESPFTAYADTFGATPAKTR